MAVFPSEIVPGDGLAAFPGVGSGSPEDDGEGFREGKGSKLAGCPQQKDHRAPHREQPDRSGRAGLGARGQFFGSGVDDHIPSRG